MASASSSDVRRTALVGALLLLAWTIAGPAAATVFYSQKEALETVFPDCEIREQTWVLDAEQTAEIEKRARSKLESSIVTLYEGRKDGELVGHAFIEVHTVRTKAEAFLVAIDPNGVILNLLILAFHEPLDYLPTDRWFAQFAGKTEQDGLRVDRDIHGVVGATLSTRAVSDGVRRALAIHRVLIQNGGTSADDEAEN